MHTLETGFQQLIDGELVGSERTLDVINPATGRVFARCPAATRAQLDRAVAAARRAFGDWRATSFEHRALRLKQVADILRQNQESLAQLLTREQGKPLAQARDEIGRAFSQSEGMTRIAIPVETLVEDMERRVELHYAPLGVVGVITPWNAPINLAAGPLTAATRWCSSLPRTRPSAPCGSASWCRACFPLASSTSSRAMTSAASG
jgi:acyl-CoA reductase-like NAD-dependent aldehyde dehydrogenase